MLFLIILMSILIMLSLIIVFSKNTINSILCLILCFVFTAVIFFILNAEFLAYIIIIVYASAISILFIFIIMLLNLRLMEVYYINFYYIPLCIFINIFLILVIYLFLLKDFSFFIYNNLIINNNLSFTWLNYLNVYNYKNNLYMIGIVLYNNYYIFVIIAGLILFLAMIGAILIVLNVDKNSKSNKHLRHKCMVKNYQ